MYRLHFLPFKNNNEKGKNVFLKIQPHCNFSIFIYSSFADCLSYLTCNNKFSEKVIFKISSRHKSSVSTLCTLYNTDMKGFEYDA